MDVEEQPSVKKRRRLGARVRVTRACDLCKKKKLRCTGTQPCTLCVQLKQDCTFMSEYNRGKVPCISTTPTKHINTNRTANTDPGRGHADLEPTLHQQESTLSSMAEANALGDDESRGSHDQEDEASQVSPQSRIQGNLVHTAAVPETTLPEIQVHPDVRDAGRSSRNSPEPAQTDQEGHYVGPASGVSFLSRALKKLHETSHSVSTGQQTSVFNFADAPVPQYDPYFLILPSQVEAEALIRRYFDFASPTHRYLHQPTVEGWCEEFYNSIQNPGPLAPGAHEIRAIILAVLAVAKQYSSSQDPTSYDTVNSTAFFAASEHHLQLESGGIRLTSIQARLVQCYYLLSRSRVNSAWGLFGTIANLVLAIGLHRRRKRDATVGIDLIEHECRKRVFWSAYILDSYLTAGLGRPRSFHEEDLDQEMPLCVDDWQITPTKILPRHEARQSLTQASIYHAKLLKIISGILRDLYGIRRPSHEKQEEVTQLYDARLVQWREELGAFLDITNTEIMMPIFRRQHSVLHMAYSHAIILLHRQALLVRPSASAMRHEHAVQMGPQYSVRRCLDAANIIVMKLRELVEKQQMYSAFWVCVLLASHAERLLISA
ncbi:fungal-specific transcription factor domain-containing protein [Hypoxylon trugodes]|uniref:fungal-specific transcription factor domain-containing protein n=1 Tax=Hypoxylon trugodes TaxID=326681 RepID=UPI002196037F|nr:fungal-specific transcription factor domain-containing protein [Hypoxylon trugodes]KAI1390440.1 fungal-specific transcription factor domain-containing protein [Hypoxylon trugodes]